jgi:hypothetical protein
MGPLLRIAGFLLVGSAAVGAPAQELVPAGDIPAVARVFDKTAANSLPCDIQFRASPWLDFMFRYTQGFEIHCRTGSVIPPGAKLLALIRITPQAGQPTWMMERFDILQAPKPAPTGSMDARSEPTVWMNGGFAIGPGQYVAEVVLTDEHDHTSRSRKALTSGENKAMKNLPAALPPGAVAPLLDASWNGALASPGLRLTILLNAYGQAGRSRLDTWDRTYLLQSLASLLNQIPCHSVKLVAFNLDRQQEIFSQDVFDADGFLRLGKILEQTDLASIPYRALIRGTWAQYLVDLEQKEAAPENSADTIIFLGAWGSHEWDKVPKEMVRKLESSNAHIFYFEYFPAVGGAPDAVQRLTRDLHGAVFAISSPETLAQAIKQTLAQTGAPSD